MEWYTTKEASEKLQVTPSRVRQLVARHRDDNSLVRSTEGKNQVSSKLIKLHLDKVADHKALQKKERELKGDSHHETPHATPNNYDTLLSALEGLENGLHVLPNGNHVQIFTDKEYSSFEQELIEARGLALQLAQEQDRRKYAEKQVERQNEIINSSLAVMQASLESIAQSQESIKREQYIRYEQLKEKNS